MKYLSALFLIFTIFCTKVYADECTDFTQKFFTESKKNSTISQHRQYFIENIDTKYITKYSLGTKWRTLSPEQRKDFYNLYSQYVVYKYAGQFIKYPILGYNVVKSEIDEKKKELCNVLVNITTVVNKQEKTIPLTAILTTQDTKIRDINIENISILQAQKQEIESLMSGKGYEGTMDTLKEFIESQK